MTVSSKEALTNYSTLNRALPRAWSTPEDIKTDMAQRLGIAVEDLHIHARNEKVKQWAEICVAVSEERFPSAENVFGVKTQDAVEDIATSVKVFCAALSAKQLKSMLLSLSITTPNLSRYSASISAHPLPVQRTLPLLWKEQPREPQLLAAFTLQAQTPESAPEVVPAIDDMPRLPLVMPKGYRKSVSQQFTEVTPRLTIEEIKKTVTDFYQLEPGSMESKSRARSVARPRQVAMYLCKHMTDRSFPEIGRRFGGRDHSTVIHGIRAIEELRIQDPQIHKAVNILENKLKIAGLPRYMPA